MTVVNLGLLTPNEGFHITGGGTITSVGASVSSGDVNGDGFDDMIIVAGSYGSGAEYVVFGKQSGFADINLYFLDSADGLRIGDASSGSSAGDINGDGFDDLLRSLAGSYGYYDVTPGATYVQFGAAHGVTTGFRISGVTAQSGNSVSSAGDVNGDGFDDIVIGDVLANSNGAAYVIFGKASGFTDLALGSLSAADGFRISGEAADDYAGYSVASAGDVNGDGFGDIIISAKYNDDGGYNSGAAYVIFGKASGFTNIDLATLSLTNGFEIIGAADGDQAGKAGSSAGDINGDGFDDILVGALNDAGGLNAGAAYVIFGKASGFANIDLASMGAADGFKIIGDAAYDNAGVSVSSAGDFNGDGFDDIIVGAPLNAASGTHSGAVYLIYGHAGGFTDIDLGALSEVDGFKIIGDDSGDETGLKISSAGDVNRDGFNDLMVAAPYRNANGLNGAGEVYILFGHPTVGVVVGGTDAGETISGGNFDDTLDGRGGNDILNGLGGDDTLIGGIGSDLLDGGAGADTLIGGTGFDIYVVDNANDIIAERASEGTDRVQSSITYTLGDNLEKLTLTGSGVIKGTGNALANTITGNGSANVIDGGSGADTLQGGLGNDTYVVDNAGDLVTESASAGNDLVKSSVSFTLGANVEKLTLTGSANIGGTGNELNNVITGNSGANVLDGGAGADTLSAGAGNDIIHGGDGNDRLTGGAGIDKFYFDTALGASTNFDTITDFAVIDDTVFLDRSIFSAIAADGTLTGAGFFAGTAAHDSDDRIVYDSTTGKIYYDADGNGAGAAVQFAKVTPGTPLTHSDFKAFSEAVAAIHLAQSSDMPLLHPAIAEAALFELHGLGHADSVTMIQHAWLF